MGEHLVTAVDMARKAGVDPKSFRGRLREAGFAWHAHGSRWAVADSGAQHRDMLGVLAAMLADRT